MADQRLRRIPMQEHLSAQEIVRGRSSAAAATAFRSPTSDRTKKEKQMKGVSSAIVARPWAAFLLVLFLGLLGPYLPSRAQETTPNGEAESLTTPAIDLNRPSAQPRKRTAKVPILVYHHISQSVSDGSRALRRLTVNADVFAQQMKYLQDNGYHVITFSALADYLEQGRELPTFPVIISFDDGWETQFEYARASLEKYHFPATFFIVTDYVGRPGFITWPQLQILLTEGMRIGSHSRSHPHLDRITSPTELWDQISNSKTVLETQLESPVEEFAYPYGSYTTATAAVVKQAGYRSARGCCSGFAHTSADVFALRAVMVPNDLVQFEKYLQAR